MAKLIVKTKETIDARDHALYFDYMFGQNGILNKGNRLDLTVQSANLVKLKDGIAVIQGRPIVVYPNEVVDVKVESGTQGMKRNDIVVVEFVKSTSSESFSFKVVKGTPNATNAIDPNLTQQDTLSSGTIFQLPLYRIRLNGINVEGTDDLREFISTMYDGMKPIKFDSGILTVWIPDNITLKGNSEESNMATLEEPAYISSVLEKPIDVGDDKNVGSEE